jgi:hypothetical protein
MSDLEQLGKIFTRVLRDASVDVNTYEEYIDGYPKLTRDEWSLIRNIRYGKGI